MYSPKAMMYFGSILSLALLPNLDSTETLGVAAMVTAWAAR
jgi:hypothetical protein